MTPLNFGAALVFGFTLGWIAAVVQRIDHRTAMLVRRQLIQLEQAEKATSDLARREA